MIFFEFPPYCFKLIRAQLYKYTKYTLLPKLRNRKHNLNVEIDLYSYATELYNELDRIDIINTILRTLYKYYPEKLNERYKIDYEVTDDNYEDVLIDIGSRRGCLVKGGVVDYDKVYTIKSITDDKKMNI